MSDGRLSVLHPISLRYRSSIRSGSGSACGRWSVYQAYSTPLSQPFSTHRITSPSGDPLRSVTAPQAKIPSGASDACTAPGRTERSMLGEPTPQVATTCAYGTCARYSVAPGASEDSSLVATLISRSVSVRGGISALLIGLWRRTSSQLSSVNGRDTLGPPGLRCGRSTSIRPRSSAAYTLLLPVDACRPVRTPAATLTSPSRPTPRRPDRTPHLPAGSHTAELTPERRQVRRPADTADVAQRYSSKLSVSEVLLSLKRAHCRAQ